MAKKLVNVEVNIAEGFLQFTFPDAGKKNYSIKELNDDIQAALVMHGFKQKLCDTFAGAGEQKDKNAYIREKVDAVFDALMAGNWNVKGTGGRKTSDLAQALHRLALESGEERTLEECLELVRGWKTEEVARYSKLPAIKLHLAKIEMERAESLMGDEEDNSFDLNGLFGTEAV